MNNPYGCVIDIPIYANRVCFNNIQAAPAYSQLAAILASFVFAAIILALGTPPKNKTVKDISLPLILSFGTFISLLVSCYFYATLSGEETQVVAFAFAYAASLIFTLAALQLLLSIAWFFKTYGLKPGIIKTANQLIEIVLFIIVIHIIAITSELRIMTINASWNQSWFNTSWLNLEVALLIQIILLYLLPLLIAWPVREKMAKLQKQTWQSRLFGEKCSSPYEKLCGITIFVFIGLTVFFAVYGAVVVELDEPTIKRLIGTLQHFDGVEIILCFIFLIFALFIFLYRLSLPTSKEDSDSKESTEETKMQNLTQEVEIVKEPTSESKKQVGNIQAGNQSSGHQSKTEDKARYIRSNLLVGFSILSWVTLILIFGKAKRKRN